MYVVVCDYAVNEFGEMFLNEYDTARFVYIKTHDEEFDSDTIIGLLN